MLISQFHFHFRVVWYFFFFFLKCCDFSSPASCCFHSPAVEVSSHLTWFNEGSPPSPALLSMFDWLIDFLHQIFSKVSHLQPQSYKDYLTWKYGGVNFMFTQNQSDENEQQQQHLRSQNQLGHVGSVITVDGGTEEDVLEWERHSTCSTISGTPWKGPKDQVYPATLPQLLALINRCLTGLLGI